MPDALPALQSSVDRLTSLIRPLDDAVITRPAYPSEWTIADVLSHLGSGAVISQRRLDDALDGQTTPDDFNGSVWDEWNSKSARAKTDDALAANLAFTDRLHEVAPADRARFISPMGPFTLDWDAFVGLRLNEHLLHEWDVAVTLDSLATLPDDGTVIVIDNLDLIARFTAKPHGPARVITIGTTRPERAFVITVRRDGVEFSPAASPAVDPDLLMPAEAFIRLVYGRLDPNHTHASVTGDFTALDQLRAVFPGP